MTRHARKDAGFTQQQAAAKLGLTQAYLSMLERVGITATRFGDSTGKLTALTV